MGEPFYFFEGITDRFQDPPATLELASREAESYRSVIHHLGGESPADLCVLLLSQGEMDLAEDYCRNLLAVNPEATELLPYLRELSPDGATLDFMEKRLGDRPVRRDWHRAYVEMFLALNRREAVQERYRQLQLLEPGEGLFAYLLGKTREQLGVAQADFRRAAQLGSAEALYELSRWAAGLGDFPEALSQIEEALQTDPENVVFRALEEDLLVATRKFGQLISRNRERLEADPLDENAALRLAGLYEVTGRLAEAEEVTERFLSMMAIDGDLDEGESAFYREGFARVRAQWVGDGERYLRAVAPDATGGMNHLILEGRHDEAAASVERASDDPFLHLLLYALAMGSEDHRALAEVQLSQALKLFEALPERGELMASWFRRDASPPGIGETLEARLPNQHQRVLLLALARRHPGAAEPYLALANRLNYQRVFPFLALKKVLED